MARGARGRRRRCGLLLLLVGEGRGVCDALGHGALQALELGLLVGGEAGWRGALLEGGGVGAREGGRGSEEALVVGLAEGGAG